MRIAIFADNFYPEISGVSDSIILCAQELCRLGYEIDFYVPKYTSKNYKKINLQPRELNLGPHIKINRLPSLPFPSGTGQSRFVFPMLWSLRSMKKYRRPDIIWTQQPFGVGLEALLTAKILKIPLIGTNHTAIAEFIRYSPVNTRLIQKIASKYLCWYYNRCRFVTAPSQSVFTEMINYGFHRAHQVISNPIDLRIFFQAENETGRQLKEKFNFSHDTLVFAGRLAAEKNIDVIIKAVALVKKQLPTVNLVLAGHGTEENVLKNLTKKLEVQKNVQFLGTVDKNTLAEIYNAAEIFITASTSETQGLSMIQAMACGLPAIGARARATPEYINAQNGLLAEANDHEDLAKNIIALLTNKQLRITLGQGAKKYVQSFSVENIAKIWDNVFNTHVLS